MSNIRPFDQLTQPPIFVVGSARSGTTWVEEILAAHPEVANIDESWLFTRHSGLGSLFTDAHWPPGKSGLGYLLDRKDLLVYVKELATSIMEHAIKPGHHFLVEKSPSHLYFMPLINEIFPGSRFVHVLRDGRDVSVSVRAASKSWQSNWKKSFGSSIKASSSNWKLEINHAQKEGAKLGSRFLELRYEYLRANPSAAYRQLFNFCNISCDDSLLKIILDKTDFNKNYVASETGFRRGGRVGDWQTHFGLIDAIMFNLVAGSTLIELGYEKNRLWLPNLIRRYWRSS